uniref:Uncharacterized protein n=1 Tax=Rhizophora mucronata TaxID=61149 RepID=A0A2P2QDX5_RHIMU
MVLFFVFSLAQKKRREGEFGSIVLLIFMILLKSFGR